MKRQVCAAGAGLVVVLAVALSACGGADASAGGSSGGTDQAAQSGIPPAAPRGASGTVAAVTTSDMQVRDPRIGQVKVAFTPSTSFTKAVPAAIGDLTVGACALVASAPRAAGAPSPADQAGPITAISVLISPSAANGGCAPGGVGGPRGAGPGRSGPNDAAPAESPNRPNGAGRGRGGGALGTVESISGDSFVVRLGSSATRSVLTTRTTTFSKTVATDRSHVAVGDCVSALGPANDTGMVTATSISIRQPGPNGCQGGTGGPGRVGRGG